MVSFEVGFASHCDYLYGPAEATDQEDFESDAAEGSKPLLPITELVMPPLPSLPPTATLAYKVRAQAPSVSRPQHHRKHAPSLAP